MTRVRHTFAWGAGLTLLLHGALFLALWLLVPPRPAAMRRYERVQVRLVAPPPRPTPPPAALPPPVAPPPPAAPAAPVPRPVPPPPRVAKAAAPVAKAPPPPAPTPAATPAAPAAAAPAAPPPRRAFAVSLEATVPGGGVAVPTAVGGGDVGGTPGAPAGPRAARAGSGAAPAAGAGPARGGAPEDVGSVTRLPGLVGKPSEAELRAAYPEAARRQGLDGDVKLEILVDETGRVTRVKLVRPAGHGFDAAAERLIRQHRFRPADKAGRPVAVWIPWTYKFRLED